MVTLAEPHPSLPVSPCELVPYLLHSATPLALEYGFEPDVVVRTTTVAVEPRFREMVGAGRAIRGEGRRVPAARGPLVPGALVLSVLSGAGVADHKRCGIRFLFCFNF